MKNDKLQNVVWSLLCIVLVVLCVVFVFKSGVIDKIHRTFFNPDVSTATELSEMTETTGASEAEANKPQTELSSSEESVSTVENPEEGNDEEDSTALISKLEELETENRELDNEIKTALEPLNKFGEDVREIKEENKKLLDYSAKAFSAQYDYGVVSDIEDNNQLNHAVEEISKKLGIFGGGWFLGYMADQATANNDRNYYSMLNFNEFYENLFQQTVLDVGQSVEELSTKLRLYEELTDDSLSREEKYKNLCVLQHIVNGNDIDFSKEKNRVEDKLYIYQQQLSLARDIYLSYLTTTNDNDEYLDNLKDQVNEISGIIDVDGAAARVSDLELGGYLIPMIDKYISAYENDQFYNLNSATLRRIGRSMEVCYTSRDIGDTGRAYTVRVQDVGGSGSEKILDIFYAGGKPIYVSGVKMFEGKLLQSAGDGLNGKTLYDCAHELRDPSLDDESFTDDYILLRDCLSYR